MLGIMLDPTTLHLIPYPVQRNISPQWWFTVSMVRLHSPAQLEVNFKDGVNLGGTVYINN